MLSEKAFQFAHLSLCDNGVLSNRLPLFLSSAFGYLENHLEKPNEWSASSALDLHKMENIHLIFRVPNVSRPKVED